MTSETSSQSNPSGVYVHRETGEEIICQATGKFGNPQADAVVRIGFEYKGPVPKGTTFPVDPHAAPAATPMGVKTVAQLEAELADAKRREAEVADQHKEADADSSPKTDNAKKGSK